MAGRSGEFVVEPIVLCGSCDGGVSQPCPKDLVLVRIESRKRRIEDDTCRAYIGEYERGELVKNIYIYIYTQAKERRKLEKYL